LGTLVEVVRRDNVEKWNKLKDNIKRYYEICMGSGMEKKMYEILVGVGDMKKVVDEEEFWGGM
jgi:hypothetical protein